MSAISLLFLVVGGIGAGVGASLGGPLAGGLAAASIFGALGAVVVYALERTRPGYLAVELPVLLILLSTVTLRYSFAGGPRTADELVSNPFDIFSLMKLAFTATAAALGFLALTAPQSVRAKVTTRPTRFYAAYAVVVFLGIVASVNPLLTSYRAIEMVAGLLVAAGAYRTARGEALTRIERMIFWYAVGMILSAWIGAFIFGGAALEPQTRSPIPVRLQGIFPRISHNSLGYLSVLVALWSLARLLSRGREVGPRPPVSAAIFVLGLITLVIAQYRTGYVALIAGVAVLLVVAGRKVLAGIAVASVLVLSFSGGGLVEETQPYILRGQDTERASRLSGRVTYWSAAIPVWQESPIIGGGLQTASRLVVLSSLGTDKGAASNLHSTWVEALVGTGVVGVTMLALSLLVALWRALARAFDGGSRVVPAVILTILLVRTFTGGGIDGGGDTQLLYLTLLFGLRDEYLSPKRRAVVNPVSPVLVRELGTRDTDAMTSAPRGLVHSLPRIPPK
jgi:O-antigen ligase